MDPLSHPRSPATVRHSANRRQLRREGFTLIEVVVVIAILGILMALLLPAVQSARESARRMECQHCLRQLAIAVHEHIDAYQVFPSRWSSSGMLPLLPYLEQPASFELATNGGGYPQEGLGVDVFVCPSDPESLIDKGNLNYLYNGGTRLDGDAANGIYDARGDGFKPRDVTDGMSNTALLAERMFSLEARQASALIQNPPDRSNRRYTWYLPQKVASTPDEAAFIAACRDERIGPIGAVAVFGGPFGGNAVPYSHLLPPNSVGCFNFPPGGNLDETVHGVTATSLHPGGVNVAFCDGHVSFISDSIDLAAWRSIGTRNGHEVTSSY